jgi:hypothetical protein
MLSWLVSPLCAKRFAPSVVLRRRVVRLVPVSRALLEHRRSADLTIRSFDHIYSDLLRVVIRVIERSVINYPFGLRRNSAINNKAFTIRRT